MRDEKRIDEFCELLKKVWHKVPDWRFGQLIENLKRAMQKSDIFYIEDEVMLDLLKVYFEEPDVTPEMVENLKEKLHLRWGKSLSPVITKATM